MKLFQRLAEDISALIRAGTLRLGERIPSVREISRERNLSTATVVHAYEVLEGQGFIETRFLRERTVEDFRTERSRTEVAADTRAGSPIYSRGCQRARLRRARISARAATGTVWLRISEPPPLSHDPARAVSERRCAE